MMPQIDGFSPDGGSPRETEPECRFFLNLGELVNLADGYRRDADSSRRKDGEGVYTYWFRGEESFWDSVNEMFGNWCVKPRMSNTRVDMQQGAFVLFGLHRDALRGEPVGATRDAQYPLRKSRGRLYNRILPTERAGPDEISLAGHLVPNGAAVAAAEGGNRDSVHSQMERYVRAALRELETCGVMERVVYRDDLERHARYWEDHYRRG